MDLSNYAAFWTFRQQRLGERVGLQLRDGDDVVVAHELLLALLVLHHVVLRHGSRPGSLLLVPFRQQAPETRAQREVVLVRLLHGSGPVDVREREAHLHQVQSEE